MAIDTLKTQTGTASTVQRPLSLVEMAQAILTPLASLKLTVFLLFIATFMTFVATLEQTRADVFQVKMRHFEGAFVEIPIQTFFVPRWFPENQNIPGSIYLPSGLSILVMMLINLTAAHALSFKLKARGGRLLAGLGVGVAAAFLTWAIIFNGPNAEGFQGTPPISWKAMWIFLQVGLLGIGATAGITFFSMEKTKTVERVLLAASFLLCIGALILTLFLGEKAFIGDSAMRILWQLFQATVAGVIAFIACQLLFKHKAGIVLVHLGIAGLLVNEIYVTVTNDEQRMTIFENETVSHAIDIRFTELALIDIEDKDSDTIISIPGQRLKSGQVISDEQLPFDIKCTRYMANSDVRAAKPDSNPATEGIGLRMEAFELPPSAGTDSEQVADFASAYVEITEKETGKSLGTHLVSQLLVENKSDVVEFGGKKYHLLLRFKTTYKPYSITLKDAQREDYLGTNTPKYYASDIILNDFTNDITSDQKIWMNNPLRYSGETFYQSGMDQTQTGSQYTVLQVVTNHGWMIPYVCCMFTVVGLIVQFGNTLLKFLEKQRKSRNSEPKPNPYASTEAPLKDAEPSKSRFSWKPWVPALLILVVFGGWAGRKYSTASRFVVDNQGMRLDQLGRIPVTINGRVQPLDSVARNTARQVSKRELLIDGQGKSREAIRWYADLLFEAKDFGEYNLFRIEDPNIITALGLPESRMKDKNPKTRFRYTLNEIRESESKLRSLLPNPETKNPKSWTQFEHRLSNLSRLLERVYGARLAFGVPEFERESILERLDSPVPNMKSELIPLLIPTDDEKQPWTSFISVQDQLWLNNLADKYEVNTTGALSRIVLEKELMPEMRSSLIRSAVVEQMLATPEFRKLIEKTNEESDPEVLRRLMLEKWDEMPEQIREPLVKSQGPKIDKLIADNRARYESVLEDKIAAFNGGRGELDRDKTKLAAIIEQLRPAYIDGDADKFNSLVESYLEDVESAAPVGLSQTKLATESKYNALDPFYTASFLYLIAIFLVPISWVLMAFDNEHQNLSRAWSRAMMVLIGLALCFHVLGLIWRVVISGRPPITNLYSSVIFVTAASVAIGLIVEKVTKLGIGNFKAALGAFLGLHWAWTMSVASGDTFTVMVAVLDTQFWLSTHVVCISLGYALAFFAGLMGIGYLIFSLATPLLRNKSDRTLFSNMIYGTICFGLLCSFFGTVLGGLWGDDSWGRFWGWDPKENGALMIVLWNAIILHARWGGMVKERGLAALAAIGNIVVLWSWKGVNELGVGLHAYAGNEDKLLSYIIAVGFIHLGIAALVVVPGNLWWSYRQKSA